MMESALSHVARTIAKGRGIQPHPGPLARLTIILMAHPGMIQHQPTRHYDVGGIVAPIAGALSTAESPSASYDPSVATANPDSAALLSGVSPSSSAMDLGALATPQVGPFSGTGLSGLSTPQPLTSYQAPQWQEGALGTASAAGMF